MGKTIPDRWLEYKPFGTVLKGTKILPFKVPLKEATCRYVKPEDRFTPSTLVQAFPRLKYVIDLTNTDRYYNKQELIDSGVTYKKLWVIGHEVPSEEVVNTFFEFMNDFTSTSGEEDIIGVHCTHGINRTGYLICRYLVEQLGLDPEESIKAFAEARGYAIERVNYVTHLKRGSKKSLPIAQEEPPLTSKIKKTPFAGGSRNRLRATPHEVPTIPMRRCYVKDGCGAFPPQPPPPPPPFGFAGPRFRPLPPLRCPPLMFGGRPFRKLSAETIETRPPGTAHGQQTSKMKRAVGIYKTLTAWNKQMTSGLLPATRSGPRSQSLYSGRRQKTCSL